MTRPVVVRTTAAKAWTAAIGTTLTALLAFNSAVQVAGADDAFDAGEIGSLVTAAVSLVATVWGVWRVPNKPQTAPRDQY